MIKAYEPKVIFGFVNSNSFSIFMLICCIGYALFKISFRDLGDFFQALVMLGSFLLIANKWQFFRREPLFWLIPITVVVPILSWVNSLVYIPEHAKKTPELFKITYFLFFYLIAYWLKGDYKKIIFFWIMSAVGVLFIFIINSNDFVLHLINGFDGKRIDFNYVNANHPAVLSGSVFILFFYFLVNCIPGCSLKNISKVIFFCFFIVLFLYIVAITQSRQVYFGLFFSLIFSILYNYRKNIKSLLIILTIIIFMFFLMTQLPAVEKRISDEVSLISVFLSMNINEIPYSSTGIRIHFLYESLSWIKSHPLLGLGYDARSLVIASSDRLPEYIKDNFSHLHNGHLEVLVNYGLVGYSCFLFMFWSLLTAKQDVKYMLLFNSIGIGFIVFFIFVNFFESFLSFKSGEYIFNCIAAGLYSFHLKSKIENESYAT